MNGSLGYTIPTYVYIPTHKSLCHLLIGLAQPCPVSETVCLLALAVQSPSTNFSLLRKKNWSETSLPLCYPKPKDPSSDICCPQVSPRRRDQRGLEKGTGCIISNPPTSSFFHGLKEISYQSDTCVSSPSWERRFFIPLSCLLKYSSSPFPPSTHKLHKLLPLLTDLSAPLSPHPFHSSIYLVFPENNRDGKGCE